ncbi:MAG TPA: hypothetical protein VM222_04670 [Planctomycetota bacterium]|nr:hypothetical protein [Planctomycetota bacterium]
MKKWLIAAVAMAVMSAGGYSQDAKSGQEKTSFEKRSFPFEGDVTVERLNVRMFPKGDQNSIITSVLGLGDKVVVVAEKDEYYQILPPKGSTVFVTAKNIKREGDKGTATTAEVPVRLDSRVNADVLCTLKEGEAVKVSGEHMGWLKIEAPPAVKYYVGKKYVHVGSEAMTLAPSTPKDGGAKKASAAPLAGGSDVEAKELLENARRELDRQDKLIASKQLEQVDFTEVVKSYEAAKSKAQTDAVRAEAERGLERYRDINRVWETTKFQYEQRRKDDAAKAAEVAEKVKAEKPVSQFQGYLDTTGLLFKRPGTHKLVMGGRIIAFLRIKEGDEKMTTRLNDCYQRFVGINGTVIANPDGWDGYKVIVVDELIKLDKDKE